MSNWKRISFIWLRVKTGIWIKEEEDLARFESNNTFFDDFRFKRESLKSIIGTISRMKRAFRRKGKKAQLSITFFINRYPTSFISSTNGNTMDALEKNQTKLSSFWIEYRGSQRYGLIFYRVTWKKKKKRKRRRIFILFWPIYDRFLCACISSISKGGTLRGGGYFYRFFISLPRILQLKYPSILMKV